MSNRGTWASGIAVSVEIDLDGAENEQPDFGRHLGCLRGVGAVGLDCVDADGEGRGDEILGHEVLGEKDRLRGDCRSQARRPDQR